MRIQYSKEMLTFEILQIGNLIHDSVPISDDEENNITVRTSGEINADHKYSHVSGDSKENYFEEKFKLILLFSK